MKNEAARRLRMLADYLKTQDAYLRREGVELLNDVANEIDAHLAEHDDLMLKVLAAPPVKTLRDEWAMTHYLANAGLFGAGKHGGLEWIYDDEVKHAYECAGDAIAISKETGK